MKHERRKEWMTEWKKAETNERKKKGRKKEMDNKRMNERRKKSE